MKTILNKGHQKNCILLAILVLVAACSQTLTPKTNKYTQAEAGSSKFYGTPLLPSNGKRLMFIGQDIASINEYRDGTGIVPAGVTTYIRLSDLTGLNQPVDNGGGVNHAKYLQENYPHSAHAIAVYLVDQLEDFNAGKLDQQMQQLIDTLKSWERPIYLRWGYEADGPWNHYNPEQYKASFKKIHTALQDSQASNVALVWQVATWCDGTFEGRPFQDWYPGDDVVHWLGLSYFTVKDCNFTVLNEFMEFARSKDKPVFVAEAAPQRFDLTQGTYNPQVQRKDSDQSRTSQELWDDWFTHYFKFLDDNADVVKLASYINCNWDAQSMWGPPYSQGYWGDTRVNTNELILENWQAKMAAENDWLQSTPSLFYKLGVE